MKVTAILTAAGAGSRFSGKNTSGNVPKQFLSLKGKPIILYSLLAFQKSSLIDDILVTADRIYFDLIHKMASKNRIKKLTMLVEGGKTRYQSVRNAFRQIICKPRDLVLIHDAARPNIDAATIIKLLDASIKQGAVIPAVKIGETIKRVKGGVVTETIDRYNLWTVQTPQVFRYEILKKAYEKAGRKNDFTDEAAMVEHSGTKVRIIEGNSTNIKITVPGDLKLLKKLM